MSGGAKEEINRGKLGRPSRSGRQEQGERRGDRARKETEAGAADKTVEGRECKAGATITRERTTRQGTAGQDDICSILDI